MSNAQCSKGWHERCSHAKSMKCTCACGGENHGIKHQNRLAIRQKMERYHPILPVFRERVSGGKLVGMYPSRGIVIYPPKGTGFELDPAVSLSFRNHSPDGFNWGYGGSGAAQAALGICIALFGSDRAQKIYQDFKWKFIATLEQGKNFEIPILDVYQWADEIEKSHA